MMIGAILTIIVALVSLLFAAGWIALALETRAIAKRDVRPRHYTGRRQ
jgi:hypothetical protein